MNLKIKIFIITVVALFSFSACTNKTITIETLLQEMIDRDHLARFPLPAYTCAQFINILLC